MNYKILESNKIAIFGWPATGKTTLGQLLSRKLGIKLYSLDIIRWKYSENGIKNNERFLKDYKNIIKKDKWIIEGNALDYIDSRLEKADLLIFFESNIEKCIKNYTTREIKVKRKLEQRKNFDNKKTIKNIQDWIENRYSKKIEKLRPKLINYKDKLIIVHNYKELDKLIENFNEHKDG